MPPPPAHLDDLPVRPQPQSVWVDGEWSWTGRAYVWQSGAWVVPPADSVYAPESFFRLPNGALVLVRGAWRARNAAPSSGDSGTSIDCASPVRLPVAPPDAKVAEAPRETDAATDLGAEAPYQTAPVNDASIDTNAPLPLVQPPP